MPREERSVTVKVMCVPADGSGVNPHDATDQRALDPDVIARRRFQVARRGFDQHEVLAFLNEIAVALLRVPMVQARREAEAELAEARSIREQAERELAEARRAAAEMLRSAELRAQGVGVAHLEQLHRDMGMR